MKLLDTFTIPQLRLALLLVDEPPNDNDGILTEILNWLDETDEDASHHPLDLLSWLAVGTIHGDDWRDVLADLTETEQVRTP
jgi:hypothetical protein